MPLHLLPQGIKSLLRFEALPDRALSVAFALAGGAWTLRVLTSAHPAHPIERAPDAVAATEALFTPVPLAD